MVVAEQCERSLGRLQSDYGVSGEVLGSEFQVQPDTAALIKDRRHGN